jgi:hypothetical protein
VLKESIEASGRTPCDPTNLAEMTVLKKVKYFIPHRYWYIFLLKGYLHGIRAYTETVPVHKKD